MKTLQDKVIAITGAASGIGKALAQQCLGAGASVAIADINSDALAAFEWGDVAEQRCLATVLDVGNEAAMNAWAAEVVARFGHVDIIINNAGVSLSKTIDGMSSEQLQQVMAINFFGVANGVSAFLPYLKHRPEAHIVNVSSIFGVFGVPTQAAYNASKFAVRGYTEALQQELAATAIRVSCVLPGGVQTNIVRSGQHYDSVTGERTSTEELAKQFSKLARTSPNTAAATILRGVLKNKKRILIGRDAKVIDFLVRLLPASYDRLFGPITRLGFKGTEKSSKSYGEKIS